MIDFKLGELKVIYHSLHEQAEQLTYTIEGFIEGDETGIRRILAVQSTLYFLFCDLTSCIRALKKLQESEEIDLDYGVSSKVIKELESNLYELSKQVEQIQSSGSKRKSKSD